MSLRAYQWPRLVALNPNASVLQAARALEHNAIGAVVVQRDREVVGIVTDRDLAVRVVGRELDPRETRIDAVMSGDVVTLPPDASRIEALRLMRSREIRRIPLTDDTGLAGVVTLDDLIADEAAPLTELADVVRSQVGDGGPAAPSRQDQRAARRRAARLEGSYRRFVNEFRTEARLEAFERAEAALVTVLAELVQRLTPEEAADLTAQLPLRIGERLADLPPGPDKTISAETMRSALANRIGVAPGRADEIVGAVARVLDANVSPGQMDDVRQQLPSDLRRAFGPEVMAGGERMRGGRADHSD